MSNPAFQDELLELAFLICDGTATAEQIDRLEQLLLQEPAARLLYLQCLEMHADLKRRALSQEGEHDGIARLDTALLDTERTEPTTAEPPPTEPIILNIAPLAHKSPSYLGPGSMLFSYGISATVIILGLWIAWTSTLPPLVPQQQLSQEAVKTAAPLATAEPDLKFVGRITAMAECEWSDPKTEATELAHIRLDRKFALSSGLLEITYNTGASVILQGPCVYQVDSTHGGYLALGRLTAKVDKKIENKDRVPRSGPTSPAPRPTPFFAIRTPTALITDLGTEFGVEVAPSGASRTDVFNGRVELRPIDAKGRQAEGKPVTIGANESALVDPAPHGRRPVIQTVVRAERFIRQMPKRTPIALFNTGLGLNQGDPDPHWQLTARSDDPQFTPRQALVTAVRTFEMPGDPSRTKCAAHLTNDRWKSQWISIADDMPSLPEQVVFTFRTTFELKDSRPKTVVLRGKFMADDHVVAIRLNGKKIDVPVHDWTTLFVDWHEFTITDGFVDGTNVLEFDISNGGYPGATGSSLSPMAFRVELQGSTGLH